MPIDFDCDICNRIYGAIMHERGYTGYCVSLQLESIPVRAYKAPNELPVSEYEVGNMIDFDACEEYWDRIYKKLKISWTDPENLWNTQEEMLDIQF